MKHICRIAVIFFIFIPAFAQNGERQKTFEEIVNAPVAYRLPGMDKVRVQTNIRYTDASDPNLLMDVYTPPGLKRGERRPVVFFIHGGAGSEYKAKDWGIYRSWGRLAAASGMVGVTFTHRLGYPKPLLKEASEDVTAAINYVRTNADKYGADKDRICLAAYSAGGPMLSLAMAERPPYVKCLVAVYAFLDIGQLKEHNEHESKEMIKKFSPIRYLEKDADKLPPMLIARAGKDAIPLMNDSINRFISEAIYQNMNLTVMNHPTGEHGFDNKEEHPRTTEIIAGVLGFMKYHLGTGK